MTPVLSVSLLAVIMLVFGVLYVLVLTPEDVGASRGRRCSVKDACLLLGGLKTPRSSRGKCIRSIQIVLLTIVGILCVWL